MNYKSLFISLVFLVFTVLSYKYFKYWKRKEKEKEDFDEYSMHYDIVTIYLPLIICLALGALFNFLNALKLF